jgi:hypothetical protein
MKLLSFVEQWIVALEIDKKSICKAARFEQLCLEFREDRQKQSHHASGDS